MPASPTSSRETPRETTVVWYFGFDGHRGDYGDMGLTGPCFLGLADLMVSLAGEEDPRLGRVVLGLLNAGLLGLAGWSRSRRKK